jgi:hypothetical protein
VAVRYPRGAGAGVAVADGLAPACPSARAKSAAGARAGKGIAILAFGTLLHPALRWPRSLDATVVNMRWVKPLDVSCCCRWRPTHEALVTLEDGAIMGGAGSAVLEALQAAGVNKPVLQLGLPDKFIEHGDPGKLMALRAGRRGHREVHPGAAGAGRQAALKLVPKNDAFCGRSLFFAGENPQLSSLSSFLTIRGRPSRSSLKEGGRVFFFSSRREISMDRRSLIKHAGIAGVLAAGIAPAVHAQAAIRWRLASSFPKSLDTIFGGAEVFAKAVKAMSGGKFEISVHSGGELMPAVRRGRRRAERHGRDVPHRAYYFYGKNPIFAWAAPCRSA